LILLKVKFQSLGNHRGRGMTVGCSLESRKIEISRGQVACTRLVGVANHPLKFHFLGIRKARVQELGAPTREISSHEKLLRLIPGVVLLEKGMKR
jgi:hypothetical protein